MGNMPIWDLNEIYLWFISTLTVVISNSYVLDIKISDENTVYAGTYLRANKLSEDFMKLVIIAMPSLYISSMVTFVAAGATFYYIHDGYVETANLYLPLKIR